MQKIDYTTYQKPSDFLKIIEGENIIRIMSDGFMATIYGMSTANGWVRFGETLDEKVRLKYGNKIAANRRYIWIALNRITGQIGILEVGKVIGDAICEEAKKSGKDPRDVDWKIIRNGTGRSTKYQTTIMTSAKEVSQDVLARIEKEKVYLLNKYFGS